MVKLILSVFGALVGLAATGLGLVPVWAVVMFAAGGLLAWGVLEYMADRPVTRVKKYTASYKLLIKSIDT